VLCTIAFINPPISWPSCSTYLVLKFEYEFSHSCIPVAVKKYKAETATDSIQHAGCPKGHYLQVTGSNTSANAIEYARALMCNSLVAGFTYPQNPSPFTLLPHIKPNPSPNNPAVVSLQFSSLDLNICRRSTKRVGVLHVCCRPPTEPGP
jgi:hypothetical protein